MITQLGLDEVVLVAHDASGPPAIDWALAHPTRVAALVLLNTYYGRMPSLRAPEAIILYSTPILRNLARPVMRRFDGLDRRLYSWQVGRFIRDDAVRRDLLPQFYDRFRAARPAFWRLNADLPARSSPAPAARRSCAPLTDRYGSCSAPTIPTSAHVARRFARLFPNAQLQLIDRARLRAGRRTEGGRGSHLELGSAPPPVGRQQEHPRTGQPTFIRTGAVRVEAQMRPVPLPGAAPRSGRRARAARHRRPPARVALPGAPPSQIDLAATSIMAW